MQVPREPGIAVTASKLRAKSFAFTEALVGRSMHLNRQHAGIWIGRKMTSPMVVAVGISS
jgi:hypothetical protein